MNLKSRKEPMNFFDLKLWNRLLMEELQREQKIWGHLMMLDKIRQLREICGVPHKRQGKGELWQLNG